VNAVEFQGVSKSYAIYDAPGDRLKELLSLNRLKRHRDFWALHEVSFEVKRGETFCVVGENGSGKSTLLQMVAGILHPTSGTVGIDGRVSALLELGAGFNPEFSGRDNVYLNGAISGFSGQEIDARFPQIEDFAEIGEFMNRPIKTYSSGMVVRLAFAVAIHADPEILLVDEALSVGDVYFRQKCMRKVHELRSRGITIVFVSHAIADVSAIGDRTLWLDHGRVRELGDTEAVVAKYLAAMARKDAAYVEGRRSFDHAEALPPSPVPTDHLPNVDHRSGDGRARVTGIALLDETGEPVAQLQPSSRLIVRIAVRADTSIRRPIVGDRHWLAPIRPVELREHRHRPVHGCPVRVVLQEHQVEVGATGRAIGVGKRHGRTHQNLRIGPAAALAEQLRSCRLAPQRTGGRIVQISPPQRLPTALPSRFAKPALDLDVVDCGKPKEAGEFERHLLKCAAVEPLQADAAQAVGAHGHLVGSVRAQGNVGFQEEILRTEFFDAAGPCAIGAVRVPSHHAREGSDVHVRLHLGARGSCCGRQPRVHPIGHVAGDAVAGVVRFEA